MLSTSRAQLAPVNPPTGGFRINGTLRSNTVGEGDWVKGTASQGDSIFHYDRTLVNSSHTGRLLYDLYNSSSDNIFSGSAFNDNPNKWKWTNSSATNKCDINNGMYLVTTSSSQKWMIIGGDRLTTQGTSYIDFEFLQGTLTRNTTNDRFTSSGPDSGRTVNDFVISMEYSNGGSNANVHFYQWEAVGTDFKYVEHPVNAALAYGMTNLVATDVPIGAFGTTSYIPFAFVEAAVNIDGILSTLNPCTNISIRTLFIKTKASDAINAALKDFVEPEPVQFTFGSASISYGGPFCKTGTASVTQTGTPGGTYASPTPSDLIVDATTGQINLAASSAGTWTVTYTFNSGGGCNLPISTQVTIKPIPSGSGGPAALCSGVQTNVALTTSNVTGASYTWTVSTQTAPTGGSLLNYSVCNSSCGTAIAQTITNTGTSNGVARYVVTPTAAGCVGPTFNVDVTVYPVPSVSAGSAVCAGSTITLSPTTGGTWASSNPTVATVTNGGVVSGLVAGTVTFTFTNSTTGCSNTTSPVTVNARPSAPSAQGDIQCALNPIQTLTATATPPSGGSIVWYDAATNGAVVNLPTLSSVATVTYYAQAVQNTCTSSSRTAATLRIKPKPDAPVFVITQPTLCGTGTGSVQICNPSATSTYTLVGGTSTTTSGSVIFSGLAAGSNPSFTVTTEGCASAPASCGSAANTCPSLRSTTSNDAFIKEPVTKTITSESIDLTRTGIKVKAFPNPYNDQVKFVVTSPESGEGRLDVLNVLGQNVKTVYQGQIHAGSQTFELKVPPQYRSTLIYTLTIGGRQVSGKLVQFKD